MLITERDYVKIQSYEDFQVQVHYLHFVMYRPRHSCDIMIGENDPLSNDDPAESILSRYDLRPASCLHSGTTISVLIQIMRTGTMTMCPSGFCWP